jgi:ankyrin repeat protein
VSGLKLEAKRWLHALDAGDAEAIQRLKAVWVDAPEPPTLRTVQQALAREHGFSHWAALRDAVEQIALDRQITAQTRADHLRVLLSHGWRGEIALARRLLSREPELAADSVFTAAAAGEVDVLRRMLAQQPELVRATDSERGWTPLLHVAYGRLDGERAVEAALILLDAGADPNAQFDDGWGNPFTALCGVIGQGEGNKPSHPQAQALAELLLARGADPFDTQVLYNTSIVHDEPHWTAWLWEACVQKGRESLWFATDGRVLSGPVRVHTMNYLLGNAVSNRHVRRAAWLLAHGADAKTPHSYVGRPVHTVARLAGFRDLVALLEAHGASAEVLPPRDAALAQLVDGQLDTVRDMLAAHPALLHDPHLLHGVAARNRAEAVQLLLTLGAPVDLRDATGATPLHRAAEGDALEAIEVLLGAGAAVDLREHRFQGTPFSWSLHLGRHMVSERLAGVTRDVRALTRSGNTARLREVLQSDPSLANHRLEHVPDPVPLFCLPDDDHLAAEVANELLAAGADTTVRNAAGRSPYEEARFRGLELTAARLRSS